MLDPQGYPIQQYTDLKNNVVLEVMSDGTIVLITGVTVSSGTGSPEGVKTAPVGSLYINKSGVSPNILYQKQTGTGNTGWAAIGGGGGGGVTSFNGRVGAVLPDALDYSGIPFLQLDDGSNFILFNGASGLAISAVGGDSFTFDGAGNDSLTFANTLNLGGPVGQFSMAADGSFTLNANLGGSLFMNAATKEISFIDGTGSNGIVTDGVNQTQVVGGDIVLLGTISIQLNAPKIRVPITGLQIFANNAAAITGGLVSGDLYRTGADPDVICVVH